MLHNQILFISIAVILCRHSSFYGALPFLSSFYQPLRILHFVNSTSAIDSILFKIEYPSSQIKLSDVSRLNYTNCIVELKIPSLSCVVVTESKLQMERLIVLCAYEIRNLVHCEQDTHIFRNPSSSVTIESSEFRDLSFSIIDGGLICGSDIHSELIVSCLFRNVTNSNLSENEDIYRQPRKKIMRHECILFDSELSGGVNGLYGGIVSGINVNIGGDGYSFICHNTTFINTERNGNMKKMMNPEYSYASSEYSTRFSLSTYSSYEFVCCAFINCYAANAGAAIYFYSLSTTTESVVVMNCSFLNCTSADHAGAVMCWGASVAVLSGCSFTQCKCVNGCYGGAGYYRNISTCISVKNTLFESLDLWL